MKWLKLQTDWGNEEWLVVLSAESRLAWIYLRCYVKQHGIGGTCKAPSISVFAHQHYLNESAVNQMIRAAVASGALDESGGQWSIEEQAADETGAERQRRFRERNGSNALRNDGNDRREEKRREEKREEDIDTDTPKISRFRPPSAEDVKNYMEELGSAEAGTQAATMVDFYTAKGWKVGSSAMKDWKAAARNWLRRARGTQVTAPDVRDLFL